MSSKAKSTAPPQTDDTGARILDAAARLMSRHGFDATSAQDVADDAGVNKALIFYHFGNKSRLFEQVLERYLEGLHEALSRAAADAACAPQHRVHAMIDAWIDYIEAHPEYPALVQRELANAQGRHDLLARYNARNFQLVDQLIAPLCGGKKSATASHQLYTSFVGMVLYYHLSGPVLEPLVARPFGPTALGARRQHVHWMIDAVLGALCS
jgi:AcrR family transcriptional regulator